MGMGRGEVFLREFASLQSPQKTAEAPRCPYLFLILGGAAPLRVKLLKKCWHLVTFHDGTRGGLWH